LKKIYPDFRDEDGYHLGTMIIIFSNVVNSQLLNESDWPRVATDYLKPQFSGGKLAITYPNDDDAVLFLFKQVIAFNCKLFILANLCLLVFCLEFELTINYKKIMII
jgi:hypothetical protein